MLVTNKSQKRLRKLTTIVPVIECSKDKKMPPVVRVTAPVNFSDKPTFRRLGDVNHKGDDDENVHPDDAWNENLKNLNFKYQLSGNFSYNSH